MGWNRDAVLWASVQIEMLARLARGAERRRLETQAGWLIRRGFAAQLAAMLDGVA